MKSGQLSRVYWGALIVVALAMLVNIYLALAWVQPDAKQGDVGRIFFFHVPGAWVGLLSFLLVSVASIGYLIRRTQSWDRVAVSAAELGVVFITITLITGPIWAKVAWGIWWTWDARLTSTLVLFLLFCGYLMLRRYIPEPSTRAKLSAVVGIVSAVDVPIVFFAIRWWRTQHPQPVIAGEEGSGLGERESIAFFYSFGVFTMLYLVLLLQRVHLARLDDEVEVLKRGRTANGPRAAHAAWLLPFALALGLGVGATPAVAQEPAPNNGSPTESQDVAQLREQLETELRRAKTEADSLEVDRAQLDEKNSRAIRHMMIAYATVWGLIILYLISVSRRQSKLRREIDELSGGR